MIDSDMIYSQTMRQPNTSLDDLWDTVKGGNQFGIDGYEVPRKYLDPRKIKKDRENGEQIQDQLKHPKKYWPIMKNDEPVVFKRPNYLDDVYKWCNSFYDKEKAEKALERINSKNKTGDGKNPPIPKFYKHDRDYYIDHIIRNEKKKEEIYNFREEAIETTKEKIKTYVEKKEKIEKDKLNGIYDTEHGHNYKTWGSLPRCDRVTIVADSEHVGEKLPFCNQPEPEPKTVEVVDHKGRKRKVENFARFNYPKKNATWHSSPKWGFMMKKTVLGEAEKSAIEKRDQEIKDRKDRIKEYVLEKNKARPKVFESDVPGSFNKLLRNKKIEGPALVQVIK